MSSQVDGELRELRIRFAKTRYRILYRRSGLLFVLLHIFEKNTDKLPGRDLRAGDRTLHGLQGTDGS